MKTTLCYTLGFIELIKVKICATIIWKIQISRTINVIKYNKFFIINETVGMANKELISDIPKCHKPVLTKETSLDYCKYRKCRCLFKELLLKVFLEAKVNISEFSDFPSV